MGTTIDVTIPADGDVARALGMNSTNTRLPIVLPLILAALLTAPVHAEQGAAIPPAAAVNSLIAKEKSSWTLAINTFYQATSASKDAFP